MYASQNLTHLLGRYLSDFIRKIYKIVYLKPNDAARFYAFLIICS